MMTVCLIHFEDTYSLAYSSIKLGTGDREVTKVDRVKNASSGILIVEIRIEMRYRRLKFKYVNFVSNATDERIE